MSRKKNKTQKVYKMRGCSKKTSKCFNLKRGGTHNKITNLNLAYPTENIFSIKNPNLAYVGRGGNKPIYPNTGPKEPYPGWLNPSTIRGGGCGCGSNPINLTSPTQNGGGCSLCNSKILWGGENNHRQNCLCSLCKNKKQRGGNNGLPYGENLYPMKGLNYPNGLVGKPWGSNYEWPGTTNTNNYNHYSDNNYKNDIQLQIKNIGAQHPYLGGSRKKYKNKTIKNKKGGNGSNGFSQDFVNLGRQFTYGLGSAYNSLRGFEAPTNPLPWQGQLAKTPNISSIKNSYL